MDILDFPLQRKCYLNILFPLNPLIPNLSMGYNVVINLNSVSKKFLILLAEFLYVYQIKILKKTNQFSGAKIPPL